MLAKTVLYFGQPSCLCCDGICAKAWGINNRPREQLSDNEVDYAYLADSELGEAPADPGTYEGGFAKPVEPHERLNKWCARECERSDMHPINVLVTTTPDFSKRRYNMRAND